MNNAKTFLVLLLISSTICCMDQNNMNILSPIELAIKNGDMNRVQELIESDPILINAHIINTHDGNHWTLLHLAAFWGQIEITQHLLQCGANVNALSENHTTPLHLAANIGVAHLLLQHGAKVNAQTVNQITPLHLAVLNSDDIETAHLLLQHGANVNAFDNNQRTPLYVSAQHCRPQLTKLLLQHGGIINFSNNYQCPDPQQGWLGDWSLTTGFFKVVQLLKDWSYYKRYRQRQLLAFFSTQHYQESPANILVMPIYHYIAELVRSQWINDTIEQIHDMAQNQRQEEKKRHCSLWCTIQ